MFDPTAFDNMKVVIEGALYDLDLSEEILITDRNDVMNLAKLSRSFDISFKLREAQEKEVTAKFETHANLTNLAAELLPGSMAEKQAGSFVKLQFMYDSEPNLNNREKIQELVVGIWGDSRNISQKVIIEPFETMAKHIITIDFHRLIREEQMEDLVDMIHFMVTTLQRLSVFVKG